MAEAPAEEVQDSAELSSSEATEADRHEENEQQTEERLCDPFLDRFAGMMNHKNMESILQKQTQMLGTLEVANEKLASLNDISQINYQAMAAEFRQSTQSLMAVKRDLDSIFRRIRSLKTLLATQYPSAYAVAENQCIKQLQDEDDET